MCSVFVWLPLFCVVAFVFGGVVFCVFVFGFVFGFGSWFLCLGFCFWGFWVFGCLGFDGECQPGESPTQATGDTPVLQLIWADSETSKTIAVRTPSGVDMPEHTVVFLFLCCVLLLCLRLAFLFLCFVFCVCFLFLLLLVVLVCCFLCFAVWRWLLLCLLFVFGCWFWVDGFLFLVSGFWFLVSGFWFGCLVCGFWFCVACVCCWVFWLLFCLLRYV